jgi:hypothetical protein
LSAEPPRRCDAVAGKYPAGVEGRGGGARWRRKNEKVLECYHRALEIDIKVSGQECPDVAATLMNMDDGDAPFRKGDWENALLRHKKSLDINIRVCGHAHQ